MDNRQRAIKIVSHLMDEWFANDALLVEHELDKAEQRGISAELTRLRRENEELRVELANLKQLYRAA